MNSWPETSAVLELGEEPEIAQLLLDADADVNIKDGRRGMTPLQLAQDINSSNPGFPCDDVIEVLMDQ